MPAVTSAADEESKAELARQQMRAALKKHIIRERQRKKEEHEAEVEEERLRKEREARERQDVMTLGETREQIQQLDQKLTQLKDEKHQLFLQLKKVLNEDDNRKRQQNKDSNEMLAMNGMVSGGNNMVQSHLFLPPTVSQGNPIGRPPLSAHVLNKSGGACHKRGRSPSPSYLTMVAGPHSAPYLHHSHHKQQHTTPYQHKIEDGRCREMSRAVLWNKPSQYSSGGGGGSLYALPPQTEQRVQPVMYGAPLYHPHHVQHHTSPKQQVVMSVGDSHQERGGGGGYNPSSASPASSSSLPSGSSLSLSLSSVNSVRHPQQLMSQQMHQAVAMQHNNVQSVKQGGITSGYPVRQQNPTVQNPNLYPNRHRY